MGARGTALAILLASMLGAVPARAATPLFGFNDNATLRHELSPERDARLLSSTGADSMRIVVDWTWVERRHGTLDLSLYDPIYQAMLARGIRPLLDVMGSPPWAWTRWTLCFPAESCHVAPDRSQDAAWAGFVAAVARRFPRAAAIEIWNEPNLKLFFRPAPDPQRYTELLRIGRDAVKTVAPDMPVLGGALAPVMGDGDANATGLRPFLAGMYASGAAGAMDGLSVHPYPGGRGEAGVYDAIDAAVETRDAAGDAAPLWLTELGASTTGGFSMAAQATFLHDVVPRLLRRPGVRGVYLHTLTDARERSYSPEDGFGIITSDGAPKPAWCAVAALFRKVACPYPAAGAARQRWDAQEALQRAAEAALAWRRASGSYLGFASSAEPADVDAAPGRGADPARIAVLAVPGSASSLRLCNTSAAVRSYCLTLVPGGPWRFTSAAGSIARAVAATEDGSALPW